jgi:translation initiation factor IF-3
MDYGKFRYAQKKKAQESRKKSAATILKEVKVGSQTSAHDVDFKLGHIRDFLGEGHRVKVSRLLPRPLDHASRARQGDARPDREKLGDVATSSSSRAWKAAACR